MERSNSLPFFGTLTLAVTITLAGCANLRIDPSGQSLFTTTPPGAAPTPSAGPTATLPAVPQSPGVAVSPRRVIAQVGTEVVLVSTVYGNDGLPDANQQMEWLLAPDSAGYLVTPSGRDASCFFGAFPNQARKVTNHYAVGSTLNQAMTITRGTASAADDVQLAEGQSWIVVASPTEGSSYVSAFAPQIADWSRHLDSATIHWVDAQWTPPPAAVNPVGTRGTLTTAVMRQSDGTPVQGWKVRYEIVAGPPAGFTPDGASIIEVVTDDLGQSTAEIIQTQPATGTNQIKVDLIRPAELAFSDQQPLLIGSTVVERTWTSPDISLVVSGPAQTALNSVSTYRIQVSNPGSLATRDVQVTAEVPAGFSFVGSLPESTSARPNLSWQISEIPTGQTQTVEVRLRAEEITTANFCANVRTGEGLAAQDCATTTVTAPSVEVTIQGPQQAQVGDTVNYQITVLNRGTAAAAGLVVIDRFDPGFLYEDANGRIESPTPIESDVEDVPAGGSRIVTVPFRAVRQGRHCQNIEIRGANDSILATSQLCVDITAAPEPQRPPLTVNKVGPTAAQVDETVQFTIEIRNDGRVPVSDVRIVDEYPLSLEPLRASEGFADTGELIWEIPTLLPGQSRRYVVECQCMAAETRACTTVSVTAAASPSISREVCLEIRAAGSGGGNETATTFSPPHRDGAVNANPSLSAGIFCSREEVAAGTEFDYWVVLTNVGETPLFNLEIQVDLPANVSLVEAEQSPTRLVDETDGKVLFEPLAELRPLGDRVQYRLRVKTDKASAGTVAKAILRVTDKDSPHAAIAEVTTNVITSRP